MEYLLIRLGIVGAGAIVQSHIDAAKLSGFDPTVVCGREDSIRALRISEGNHGLSVASNLGKLLQFDLDAILIAVSTDEAAGVLERCLERNLPILIEKPITIDPEVLKRLKESGSGQVRVAYNRRFYSSISRLKEETLDQRGLVHVVIPELSMASETRVEKRVRAVLENSVHILDVLGFVFGKVSVVQKLSIRSCDNVEYITAQIKLGHDFVGSIDLLFETSENSSIKCWTSGKSLELNPIENFKKSTKMNLVLPSESMPVKGYEKLFENWKLAEGDVKAKPGFLGQYNEFRNFVLGAPSGNLATLEDALIALNLGIALVDDLISKEELPAILSS
jgi:predicted dehydrogenase